MIGVFDSGEGGVALISEMRRIAPNADICFFADRDNAPYGTKTKEELIGLVKKDISLLIKNGAEIAVMACCTASSVYRYLDSNLKAASLPIIDPTATAAASGGSRIGVIATERTAASHAFKSAIHAISPNAMVLEWCAQPLVPMIESGVRDGGITRREREKIKTVLTPAMGENIDTLVLGCTHFHRIIGTVQQLFPSVRIISSAREGAIAAVAAAHTDGEGLTVYL